MRSFRRENALSAPVRSFLRGRGFAHLANELPFYEYRIDVYGYSPKRALSVAVELKLFKWQRAFEQAQRYQLCADLVFIAMPDSVIHRIDRASLLSHGIGLLAISASTRRCKEAVAAAPSEFLLPGYKDTYRRVLTGASS